MLAQVIGGIGDGDVRELDRHRWAAVWFERGRPAQGVLRLAVLDGHSRSGSDARLVYGLRVLAAVVDAQGGRGQLDVDLSLVAEARFLAADRHRIAALCEGTRAYEVRAAGSGRYGHDTEDDQPSQHNFDDAMH
jgi:hypothetical protein